MTVPKLAHWQALGFMEMPGLTQLWKALDGLPTIAWKTLRVSHNPLEKLKRSFSTLPQSILFYMEEIFENLHKGLDTPFLKKYL